jgi:hypothetical protein
MAEFKLLLIKHFIVILSEAFNLAYFQSDASHHFLVVVGLFVVGEVLLAKFQESIDIMGNIGIS